MERWSAFRIDNDVRNEMGSTSDSKLTLNQKTTLATLLRSLIDLVDFVSENHKLRCATLNTKEDGRASLLSKTPDGLYIRETLGRHFNYVFHESSIKLLYEDFLGID